MDWIQLLANLIVTGILLYVFQRVIDERSIKRLEKFKSELQSTAFEQNTKFSKLHEIRAQAIADLYAQLFDIRSKLEQAISPSRSKETKNGLLDKQWLFGDVAKSLEIFGDAYTKNKLYLPMILCEKIEVFRSKSSESHILAVVAELSKSSSVTDQFRKEHENDLSKASDIIENQISPLMADIETEFRILLGNV